MKRSHFAVLALILPLPLAAQQQGPPTTMNAVFRGRLMGMYRNLAAAFDSIPADKYGYKPTPAQQTIGYIATHLATDNYFFCNNFGAMKANRPAEETSTADSVKATWPKEKLTAQLKASIAFCTQALDQVQDANMSEIVTYRFGNGPERTAPRVFALLGHAMDMADHYSQLANYMRLNNMLPPTALPRPRPGGN
jgi:uncharacterized damage-inducible protein DinB